MAIVVGFSKSKLKFPIIAWLICLSEGTKFSHAYIKVYSESLDRDLIYQANGSGVFFVGADAFHTKNAMVEEYSFTSTKEQRTKLLQWAIDNSGKSYGYLQLLGIGIKRLFKLFGVNIANPFGDGNKAYVCTELVAEAIENIDIESQKDRDSMGLKELRDEVKAAYLAQLASSPNG